MTVWRTTPVQDQPIVELHSWQIFSVPAFKNEGTEHHINGHSGALTSSMFGGGGEGRVSSKIVEWNQENMIATTRSGRKYQLMGPPGYTSDAQYIYQRWLSINNINDDDVENVTSDYLTEEQKNDVQQGRKQL